MTLEKALRVADISIHKSTSLGQKEQAMECIKYFRKNRKDIIRDIDCKISGEMVYFDHILDATISISPNEYWNDRFSVNVWIDYVKLNYINKDNYSFDVSVKSHWFYIDICEDGTYVID